MVARPPVSGAEAWPRMLCQPLHRCKARERAHDRGGAARYLQPGVDVLQPDAHGTFRYAELAGGVGVGVKVPERP